MHQSWNGRRILSELCNPDLRKEILVAFWKGADDQSRQLAASQLARALHFREETIRKASREKKADWLALRLNSPEFDDAFSLGLMAFHTSSRKELLAAFLDSWNIPHVDGSIEEDDYTTPGADQVRQSAQSLKDRFDSRDIVLYLASAGLLMGPGWRDATWPVVDELLASAPSGSAGKTSSS